MDAQYHSSATRCNCLAIRAAPPRPGHLTHPSASTRRYLPDSEAGTNSAAASVPFLRKRTASHSGPGIMWMP